MRTNHAYAHQRQICPGLRIYSIERCNKSGLWFSGRCAVVMLFDIPGHGQPAAICVVTNKLIFYFSGDIGDLYR